MLQDYELELEETLEPRYLTWRDENDPSVLHVEVENGFSEYVAWNIDKDGMHVTFDAAEKPF